MKASGNVDIGIIREDWHEKGVVHIVMLSDRSIICDVFGKVGGND